MPPDLRKAFVDSTFNTSDSSQRSCGEADQLADMLECRGVRAELSKETAESPILYAYLPEATPAAG